MQSAAIRIDVIPVTAILREVSSSEETGVHRLQARDAVDIGVEVRHLDDAHAEAGSASAPQISPLS